MVSVLRLRQRGLAQPPRDVQGCGDKVSIRAIAWTELCEIVYHGPLFFQTLQSLPVVASLTRPFLALGNLFGNLAVQTILGMTVFGRVATRLAFVHGSPSGEARSRGRRYRFMSGLL